MASEIQLATGVVLLCFGLSYVLNAGYWSEPYKKLMAEPQQMLVAFVVFLVISIIMVRGHNLWVADWRVVVTIIGWATLLSTILFLLRPSLIESYARMVETNTTMWIRVGGMVSVLIGAFVTYMSWP